MYFIVTEHGSVIGALSFGMLLSAGDLDFYPMHFNLPYFINESRSALDSWWILVSYAIKSSCSETRSIGQPAPDTCGSG
jgi:hypothetical protein